MPPTTARDQYVLGQLGSYLCPTVTAVDKHLSTLRTKLAIARPVMAAKILEDIDRLLDRRVQLQRDAR